jgi:hypothetical protein
MKSGFQIPESHFCCAHKPRKIEPLILELPLVSLLSAETISELKRVYGDDIVAIDRNKLLALATCVTEGEISNDRLRLLLDLHRADITRLLQELIKILQNNSYFCTWYIKVYTWVINYILNKLLYNFYISLCVVIGRCCKIQPEPK